jgi:histone H3/H4
MGDSLVIQSKIKEFAKNNDVRVSSDLPEKLDAKVQGILSEAIERAKANGRATVGARDL